MKKLLIMLILTTFSFANTLHPNIKVKYMVNKSSDLNSIYLSDWVEMETSEIRFKFNKEYGTNLDIIEMYLRDSYDGYENHIASFDKNLEILSVFFHDITGDNMREMFLLTRFNNKYKIISYTVMYYRADYYFDENIQFDKHLNNIFEDYKSSLNASIIKKELVGKILSNYNSYSFDENKFYSNGETITYLRDKNTPEGEYFSSWNTYIEEGEYVEVDNIKDAHIYINKYEDNVYGVFTLSDSGFEIRELFEGKESKELPFVIKNGKYKRNSNELLISGYYKDNIKEGYWEESGRLFYGKGYYKDNLKEGEWIEENVHGKYRGLYKMGVKDGVWVEEYSGEKLIYKEGVQVE